MTLAHLVARIDDSVRRAKPRASLCLDEAVGEDVERERLIVRGSEDHDGESCEQQGFTSVQPRQMCRLLEL